MQNAVDLILEVGLLRAKFDQDFGRARMKRVIKQLAEEVVTETAVVVARLNRARYLDLFVEIERGRLELDRRARLVGHLLRLDLLLQDARSKPEGKMARSHYLVGVEHRLVANVDIPEQGNKPRESHDGQTRPKNRYEERREESDDKGDKPRSVPLRLVGIAESLRIVVDPFGRRHPREIEDEQYRQFDRAEGHAVIAAPTVFRRLFCQGIVLTGGER